MTEIERVHYRKEATCDRMERHTFCYFTALKTGDSDSGGVALQRKLENKSLKYEGSCISYLRKQPPAEQKLQLLLASSASRRLRYQLECDASEPQLTSHRL